MSWAVVVPTNRPGRAAQFWNAWERLFVKHDVHVIFVVDGEKKWAEDNFLATSVPAHLEIEHHNWGTIPDFIPRKTDMIRSWGIYRAWEAGSTYTLSLDDDVLPEGDIFDEYERVFAAGAPCSEYLDVGSLTSFPGQLRGFPFRDRTSAEVAVQYGGWNGVLDYDAPTQLARVRSDETFHPVVLPVPRGAAVTGCIMNCAWRTEYAPIMWQLPLYEGRFNRFGDIWSCLFQKRVLDALGKVMVINGKASVRHERASDPLANLEREAPGIPVNEELWSKLAWGIDDPVRGFGEDLRKTYITICTRAGHYFEEIDGAYANRFFKARDEWLALFS